MNKNSKILICGRYGLVGRAIERRLLKFGYLNIIGESHEDLDLTNQDSVEVFFKKELPEYVFMCAAKVGGIYANNKYPANFIYDNLAIQNNIIHFSHKYNVKKLLFMGSCCIYPKFAKTPIKEETLLSGDLEPTNQWYAIAKIAGLKMCQAYKKQYGSNFISVMPVNQYGEFDNFNPDNSHVIPGLIYKFSQARLRSLSEIKCWGSGNAKREFMHVDDLSDACILLMNNDIQDDLINIGYGKEYSIKDLANLIKERIEINLDILWDVSKPDGTPERLLDSSKISCLGWEPKISLEEGLTRTIKWYNNYVQK
jgi:GDP-L-fucose synthase